MLCALAVGITQLDAQGLTNEETLTDRPESIVGQDVLSEHFPAGAAHPVYIIADADRRRPSRTRSRRPTASPP